MSAPFENARPAGAPLPSLAALTAAARAAFHPENIPDELKRIPQWVCWLYQERDGKRTKPPIDAKSNGKLEYAKTNDPATWSDFGTALAAVRAHPTIAGVSFCFSPSDRLTGDDLDHIFDPAAGELDPLAAEVVGRFKGTYTELSPSGEGIRIFCYGKPGKSGKCEGKAKWLEIYSHPSHRHLTVTGNIWPGSVTAVTEQQAALDWLHERFMAKPKDAPTGTESKRPSPVESAFAPDDAALLDKARAAKNGAEFSRLYDAGDVSGHNGDHSAADLALCDGLAFWWDRDAAAMDRMFRQSGLMRPKWDVVHHASGETYGARTIAKAIEGCRETYGGKRPGSGKAGAANQNRGSDFEAGAAVDDEPIKGLNPYRGTDAANAELFIALHGKNVRYIPPWSKWLWWPGSHWRIDDAFQIARLAASVPRALYRQAADIEDDATRRKVVAVAKLLEDVKHKTNMLAAVMPHVVVHHSDLDKGHFLLNARNGTIDLLTGKLRPHERADLLTHDTDIPYHPDATCPAWLLFLDGIFAGDADLIRFVQRAFGYSLTGSTKEQVLFICHGMGSNGKGKLMNLLRKLLGSLAAPTPSALLMTAKTERHPTELAILFGKRAVVAQETNDGQRFNESLVKQLTGEDAISARRMREDFWEFEPTHKLWLATNHKPNIKGTDHAIWRRVRLIPFNVKFHDPGDGEPVKDLDMEAKLTAELPGILAWAVRGCLDWQREGLGMPEAVKVATASYQAEMDVLAAWIADCCVVKKLAEAKAADLYASYNSWCEAQGERPEAQRKWGMRLTERDFQRQKRMAGHFWLGIGLLATHSNDPYDPNDPETPINSINDSHEAGNRKDGSYGSYGASNPTPAADFSSQQPAPPPVDANDEGRI